MMKNIVESFFLVAMVMHYRLRLEVPHVWHPWHYIENYIRNVLHFNIVGIHHDLSYGCGPPNIHTHEPRNGMTRFGFGQSWPLLHMWNKVSGKVAPKCFLVQKRAHWWALCNMLLCKRFTWLFKSSNRPKFCILHSPYSCHLPKHCGAQTQKAFPINFHAIPNHTQGGMQPFISQPLAQDNTTGRKHSSQPKQTSKIPCSTLQDY